MGKNDMCILKRPIAYIIICALIFGLFVGCSNADNSLEQPLTTKETNIPATKAPSNDNEKLINNSENEGSKKVPSTLESWVGNYTFSEFAPPDQNMFYTISIYKENSDYYATISIDGFQTIVRLRAKVSGNENSIRLLFDRYLPENQFEPYSKEDILLSFEKRNSELYTTWGKIQPMLESNNKSGKVYFAIEKK